MCNSGSDLLQEFEDEEHMTLQNSEKTHGSGGSGGEILVVLESLNPGCCVVWYVHPKVSLQKILEESSWTVRQKVKESIVVLPMPLS